MKKPSDADLPTLLFPDVAAWRDWLAAHHDRGGAIWLKFAKKASGIASVTYAEALEEALCWGWIDGQVARVDEAHYRQRWGPRRPRSIWSKINRAKAERLLAEGRMQAPGLAQVTAAQRDGRWDAAYDSPRTITEPEDFLAALRAAPKAAKCYAQVSRSTRYSLLMRILEARRPETRAKRIATFVRCLARGEKPPGIA